MDETRESKVYVNKNINEVTERLTQMNYKQQQYQQHQQQQPPLISQKFQLIHQKQQQFEKPPSFHNPTNWMWSVSLSVLILAILPCYVTSSDFECGINRFNNESPLTERIVGGNNSLQ